MTPRQILIEARQLLVDKGWVPECGSNNLQGPNCVMSAIYAICPDNFNLRLKANVVMMKAIGVNLDDESDDLEDHPTAKWNDSQTSIEPILAKFDEAIASLPE